MMDMYKQAGERIGYVRVARGYSRDALADLTGISTKFLYEIETGKKGFSAGVLYKICRALKVDCNYILVGYEKEVVDKQLIEILLLFNANQTQHLATILKDIYELL